MICGRDVGVSVGLTVADAATAKETDVETESEFLIVGSFALAATILWSSSRLLAVIDVRHNLTNTKHPTQNNVHGTNGAIQLAMSGTANPNPDKGVQANQRIHWVIFTKN